MEFAYVPYAGTWHFDAGGITNGRDSGSGTFTGDNVYAAVGNTGVEGASTEHFYIASQ